MDKRIEIGSESEELEKKLEAVATWACCDWPRRAIIAEHDREFIPELINALIGMVQQHCPAEKPGYVATAGLSANEDAIFILEELGYLESVGGAFRFKTHNEIVVGSERDIQGQDG